MSTDLRTAEPAVRPARWRGRLAQLAVDTGYLVLGFPLALVSFVLVVTGVSAGVGLLVVWVGAPVLVGTLLAARGLAAAERSRLPAVLGRPVPAPVYLRTDAAGRTGRLVLPLRDPQCWLDALHGVLAFPVSVVTFSVTATMWTGAVTGLSYGLWDWALPRGPDSEDLLQLMGLASSAGRRIALYTALGLVFAVLLPFFVRRMARLQAGLGRIVLTSRAGTQAELGRLAGSRDAAIAAETVELRRLERDIHDGPQQRLVRLKMDLHRAERQLGENQAAARATLGEAATMAQETLEELRALSRGIAPPVLADRGLPAALAAVAARSPVPVDLEVDLPAKRLAPVTENTAYFLVSEALANVAKHSAATTCRVEVRRSGNRLRVVITDDGAGGAVLAPGYGLAGLSDRLQAVDGVLTVESPLGGPTRLTAELPCG